MYKINQYMAHLKCVCLFKDVMDFYVVLQFLIETLKKSSFYNRGVVFFKFED